MWSTWFVHLSRWAPLMENFEVRNGAKKELCLVSDGKGQYLDQIKSYHKGSPSQKRDRRQRTTSLV